jgi:hypothetical protein
VGSLAELWREHQHAAFPASCIPRVVEGTRLLALDAAVGASLTASLRSDGVPRPLPPGKREELARGRDLARRAAEEAELDHDARTYFRRLADLADAVLTASPPSTVDGPEPPRPPPSASGGRGGA